MLRGLKFCGVLTLNVFVALIGTAILEVSLGKMFRAHSLATILWKEWILSLICAAIIGAVMWRTWRTNATKWTWVVPSLWFALRFVPAFFANGRSLLVSESIWSQFSGGDCANGSQTSGCRDFFIFTIPFIRGVSYSAGAYLSSLVNAPKLQSAAEHLDKSDVHD